jgi:hypothetical protein
MKKITQTQAVLLLLTVQILLVLSVAGKYVYERKTRPRVWVRASQRDPNQPLRGRYLALNLLLDACDLPRDDRHFARPLTQISANVPAGSLDRRLGNWAWNVSLTPENGVLVPRMNKDSKTHDDIYELQLRNGRPCNLASLGTELEFFIPDIAKGPFPLKAGQQLWVEVTIPPSGPPRPIQLAISTAAGFQPLKFK